MSSNSRTDVDERVEVAAVEAPAEIHPCAVCPMRTTKRDDSFGYCEGCTRVTRRCRSCRQNKPMTGWGWGLLLGGMAAFLCADCRIPAVPDVCESHPRFETQLEVGGDLPRFRLAEVVAAVARSLGPVESSPAGVALNRMAACLRTDADGVIDIDVSDVPMESRDAIDEALTRNVYVSDPAVNGVLKSLRWAWTVFLQDSKPQPVAPDPAPTTAELSRQVHGEVWS